MSQTTLASMFLVCVNIMKSDYEIVDKIITDLICIIKLTLFNFFINSFQCIFREYTFNFGWTIFSK